MKKRFYIVLLCLMVLGCSFGAFAAEDNENDNVYVVKLDSTINQSSVDLLTKAIKEANINRAEMLIVEVNTYGGYIDAAISIKDLILSSPVKTVTFVNKQALSAGALISVAGEKLYMSSGSSMGAAEARLGEEKADEKTMSAWVSELRSTAEARGKNPDIMAAMADDSIAIDGIIEEGRLLTLSDKQALELGISDGNAESYGDISKAESIEATGYYQVEATWLEKFATFITNPVVSGILIALGILGLLFEMLTPGIGVGFVVGMSSFALYFAGNMVLSNLGWVAVVCFILGIGFLMLEAFVAPGFGVSGIMGLISLFSGVVLLSSSWQSAVISIVVALTVSIILVVISMKNKKTGSLWKKFVLHDRTDAESGYTSPNMDNLSYIGKEGVTLTPLRPAGQVDIDGNRVDVVTEGDFLEKDIKVVVARLDGTRIVVKQIKE